MSAPWRILDLGVASYRDVWERQLALVEERQRGEGVDTLLLVEHPHVITLGRGQAAASNVLAAGEVEVVAVERGGDVTYHGPGQLVAYPIVLLREDERDLHRFLRNLEEAVIATCEEVGLPAHREVGKTGVWTHGRPGGGAAAEPRKLCSMGIACRRWVTYHGLALNVTTDLSYFGRINPCGFRSEVMTSLERELARDVSLGEVRSRLAGELGRVLQRAEAS
ncbi:MAG: lipoyl(octanoyl) transferase LipB [Kofleriaceae bacterium]